MPKRKLTSDVKVFIVVELGCFETPAAVAEAVKAKFNVDVSRQHVESYDPTKHAGRNVAGRWKVLFDRVREGCQRELDKVPCAHRAVRLRCLDRMSREAEKIGNVALAAAILEKAAKEVGDCYVRHAPGAARPAR